MLSQQLALEFQERQSSKEGSLTQCAFRISSEGLPLLLPFITKQIVEASPIDFKHLLQYKTIKFADFVDAEFGEKASQLMLGCCVVVLRKGLFKHHLVFSRELYALKSQWVQLMSFPFHLCLLS